MTIADGIKATEEQFTDGIFELLARDQANGGDEGGSGQEQPIVGGEPIVAAPGLSTWGRWNVDAWVGLKYPDELPNGQLTVRLDPPVGGERLVSGDVFADLNLPGTRLRLGRRDNWAFGFVADLRKAMQFETRLIMPCDVAAAQPGGSSDELCKGTLELEVSGEGSIAAVWLTVLSEATGGWTFTSQVRARKFEKPEALRRRIRLYVAATKQVRDTDKFERALRLIFDPKHPLGLIPALAAAGIDAEIDEKTLRGQPELDLPVTPKSYATYVSRLVPSLGAVARKKKLDRLDWAHTLIFATHGPDAKGVGKVLNYGESFGLGSSLSRFNSRNGAALNVTRLDTIAADAPGECDAERKSSVEQLAWTLRFTAMHELSHLLNIPHAWDRARGHRMLGASEPGALSWSNYPSRHPYGASAAAHFDAVRDDAGELLSGVSKEEVLSKRRKVFAGKFQAASDLAEKEHREKASEDPTAELRYGFDAAELRFIRHAPLPHIAQGGQTFLDEVLPTPRLGRPSHGKLRLAIRVPTEAGSLEARRIRLWTWRVKSGRRYVHQFPPVTAWVTLLKNDKPVGMAEKYYDFRFDSGAVQLFIARGAGAGRSTPAISFSPDGIGDAARTVDGLPFPWIARGKLFRQMNPVPDVIAVQAVFAKGERTIRSPIVTLDFGGIRDLDGDVDPALLDENPEPFDADAEDESPPVAVLDAAMPIRIADYPGKAV